VHSSPTTTKRNSKTSSSSLCANRDSEDDDDDDDDASLLLLLLLLLLQLPTREKEKVSTSLEVVSFLVSPLVMCKCVNCCVCFFEDVFSKFLLTQLQFRKRAYGVLEKKEERERERA
jgi:hypothetical protein